MLRTGLDTGLSSILGIVRSGSAARRSFVLASIHPWCPANTSFRAAAASAAILCLLSSCVTGLTGYSHQDTGGVYPAGEVSGPPTRFIGWKIRL